MQNLEAEYNSPFKRKLPHNFKKNCPNHKQDHYYL